MLESTSNKPHSIPKIIQCNVPLHDKTWFGTGGPARYYATPRSNDDFVQAMRFAHEHNLAIFTLGSGANCLISDDGFDGLVLHPQLDTISIEKKDTTAFVHAGAGVTMPALIEHCLTHNIIGLEEFSGIPGTVGGSVYINLHYFNVLLEQFLVKAHVFNIATQQIETVDTAWFEFGYDYSKLHEKKHILLDATFALTSASDIEAAHARGRAQEIIRHRNARYPHKNTCGSFFRNFHDHEVTHMSNGKKMIYAAYYLDKVGVKGSLTAGDAIVSHQHANMIVNKGSATSGDIIALARLMQEKVYAEFAITLQPECQLVGFAAYPLHASCAK